MEYNELVLVDGELLIREEYTYGTMVADIYVFKASIEEEDSVVLEGAGDYAMLSKVKKQKVIKMNQELVVNAINEYYSKLVNVNFQELEQILKERTKKEIKLMAKKQNIKKVLELLESGDLDKTRKKNLLKSEKETNKSIRKTNRKLKGYAKEENTIMERIKDIEESRERSINNFKEDLLNAKEKFNK